MRLNVMLEPQEGLSYAQILAVALHADELGFEGLYRSDHYTTVTAGAQADATDAWATLAGLARETERIRLGTLVSPATFRPVGNLVKVAATVAEMAGSGRLDVGLGTGWQPTEHAQFGFPFEDLGTRFARLEEHLAVVRGLFHADGEPFSFQGEHAVLRDARLLPVPVPPPRIIVGGRGLRRTPALAARFAEELNGAGMSPAEAAEQRGALDAACDALGRDPGDITYSVMTGCAVGSTGADADRRLAALHERWGGGNDLAAFRDRARHRWVVGTPAQAAEQLSAFAAAGAQRIMLQLLLGDDIEMLDVLAQEVAPLL